MVQYNTANRNFVTQKSFAIILMMAIPFFASAQTESKKTEALLIEADTLLSRQDYSGALALFNKVIDKSKMASVDDYALLYKRAYCYYALENFESALLDINRYLDKTPDEQAKLLRAYINQELGDTDAQLADLNEFIAGNPGNPDLLRWRASVLMESEQYKEAQRDIKTLLVYQPGPELKSYLGLTYYYLENADSAMLLFDEVIKENPTFLQTYLYAGSLALEEEAYDLALDYIDRGLLVDKSNLTLVFYKGIALVEKKNIDTGCKCLTQAFNGGLDEVADYLKNYCYGSQ